MCIMSVLFELLILFEVYGSLLKYGIILDVFGVYRKYIVYDVLVKNEVKYVYLLLVND